ncbi:MAG: hypothetical protein RTU30_07055, partial [Candidatus Thorarchaeota archaeon]
ITYGNFDDDGLLDIAYFQGNAYYIVTDGTVPPPLMQVSEEVAGGQANIAAFITLGIVPMIPLLTGVLIYLRRKLDDE